MSTPTRTPEKPRSILRWKTVIQRTGLSQTQIYRMIDSGDFPRPLQLGPKRVGWDSRVIDRWIDETLEAAQSVAS